MSKVGTDGNVLLLTTKGRRTGRDRTIPVFYLRYGLEDVDVFVNRNVSKLTGPVYIERLDHGLGAEPRVGLAVLIA